MSEKAWRHFIPYLLRKGLRDTADAEGAVNSRIVLRPKADGPLQYRTLHGQHPTS